MPLVPPTVPMHIYDAMANKLGEPFADSYLWGATVANGRLLPHTLTAWDKLQHDHDAKRVLTDLKLALDKPRPFPANGAQSFEDTHPRLCDNDDFRAFKRRMAKLRGGA